MAAKVLLGLLGTIILAAPAANAGGRGFRTTMIRREPAINLTRVAHSSRERLTILAARLDAAAGRVSTQTPLTYDNGAYNMEFSIGTPPLKLLAQADTGSDLIWTKCGTCASCTPQGSPSYYPDMSSSFSRLPCSDPLCVALLNLNDASCSAGDAECDYVYSYGMSQTSHHYTKGYLGNETFTLGSQAVEGVGFGCTTMSEGNYGTGSGLVGLGRGPLSLVSQLDVGAFSYCLTPDQESPLLFGSLSTLTGPGVQSTPLLQDTTFYAVHLQSISIGTANTAGTGSSVVVFDSGTTLTFLTEPAYTAAKNAIVSQTTALPPAASRDDFEVCYQASMNDISNAAPQMVLHFDGADMILPVENYFYPVGQGVTCWVVQRSSSQTLSLVGNVMQTNYHIQHDIDNSVLSFQQANCDNL